MCKNLRTQISGKINRVPLKYFDSHPYGDTLSRVTNDVDTIGNSMQQAVSMVVQSVCMLIGVLIAMFVSCWQLALTVLIIVPFMAVLLFVIMKFSQPQFRKQQDELAVLNGKVEENYSGQLVIKAFNAESRTGACSTFWKRKSFPTRAKRVTALQTACAARWNSGTCASATIKTG